MVKEIQNGYWIGILQSQSALDKWKFYIHVLESISFELLT